MLDSLLAFVLQATRRLATRDSLLYEENCPTDEVDIANASILHSAVVVGLVIWMTQPCSAYTISDEVKMYPFLPILYSLRLTSS